MTVVFSIESKKQWQQHNLGKTYSYIPTMYICLKDLQEAGQKKPQLADLAADPSPDCNG